MFKWLVRLFDGPRCSPEACDLPMYQAATAKVPGAKWVILNLREDRVQAKLVTPAGVYQDFGKTELEARLLVLGKYLGKPVNARDVG